MPAINDIGKTLEIVHDVAAIVDDNALTTTTTATLATATLKTGATHSNTNFGDANRPPSKSSSSIGIALSRCVELNRLDVRGTTDGGAEASGQSTKTSIVLRNCRQWLLSSGDNGESNTNNIFSLSDDGNGLLANEQDRQKSRGEIRVSVDSSRRTLGVSGDAISNFSNYNNNPLSQLGHASSSSTPLSWLTLSSSKQQDGEIDGLHLNTGIVTNPDLNDTYLGAGVHEDNFQDFYKQLFASPEMRLGELLVRYVLPIIIILGNINNFIVLFVLRRHKLRSNSVAFYLSAFAIANLCVLDLMLGITWLCGVFEMTHITMLADWTCRLWTFISNVITYSGIWLVLAASVDRLVYMRWPNKAQSYCTLFAAKTVVSFVLIGLVVVSIHAMWTYELHEQGCFVSYNQDLHTIIWPWWSATVYSYIPLILLLILSLVQIIPLCYRAIRRQPLHTNQTDIGFGSGGNFVTATIVLSFTFFILTVPNAAINLVDIHLPAEWLEADLIARLEFAKNISNLLSCLNNSILGFVLIVCSGEFRTEFVALFSQWCCKPFCCSTTRSVGGSKCCSGCCSSQSSLCRWCCCSRNKRNTSTKRLDVRNCHVKTRTFTVGCCCFQKRLIKGLEMGSVHSKPRETNSIPRSQVDYELCKNTEDSTVTNV